MTEMRSTVKLSGQTYALLTTIKEALERLFEHPISYDQVIHNLITLKVNMADMEEIRCG